MKRYKLVNPCKYSFRDLASAAFPVWDEVRIKRLLDNYYYLIQDKQEKDKVIEQWCRLSGWFYEDVTGSDGKMYRAFSPMRVSV